MHRTLPAGDLFARPGKFARRFYLSGQRLGGAGDRTHLLLRHQGSDDSAWQGHPFPLQRMKSIYQQNRNAEDRVGDLRLAIAMMDEANGLGTLPVSLDMNLYRHCRQMTSAHSPR